LPEKIIGYLICEEANGRRQGTDVFLIDGRYYVATGITSDLNCYKKSYRLFNMKIAKIEYSLGNFTNKSYYKFLGWVDINGVLIK